MKKRTGDLWGGFVGAAPYATVITTNGDVGKNGQAIMGKGTALQAAEMFPEIKRALGHMLSTCGNHCYVLPALRQTGAYLVTFPTKHRWKDRKASLKLIEQSAGELVLLADLYEWERAFLPRPGCGAGGLNWEAEVRPLLKDILDDRFTVVHDTRYDVKPKKKAGPAKVVVKKGVK